MAKRLTRCPVCEATLGVTELACGRCHTRIQGEFDPCRFCSLPADHLTFLETFLRCEGNLSRVEKELNLSYPTVRNRLSAALAALGFHQGHDLREAPPDSPPPSQQRQSVLEALARGEISAEEAAEALRELSE